MNHFVKISIVILTLLMYTPTLTSGGIPRTMYVLNNSAETLSKLNLETAVITMDLLTVGQIPNQIAIHDDLLYVINSGTDDIMVVNPRSDRRLLKTIALPEGSNPWFIAFPDETTAYVTNWLANTVSVIDLETDEIVHDIEVGIAPQGILIYENRAFVANSGYSGWGAPYATGTVSIIDTGTDSVIHTINVPTNVQDFAVDPLGRIHAICTGDYFSSFGAVTIIDLHTGPGGDVPAAIDTIHVGGSPGDIAISNNGKGYCIAWGDGAYGHLYSYDALTHAILHDATDPIRVGPNVSRIAYDTKENVLWIPTMTSYGGDGFVQKYDVISDSIIWQSGVLGSGSYDLAILEPINDVTIGVDDEWHPDPALAVELMQNYPNPFNPQTKIGYRLKYNQNIRLTISNQRGQLVKTLVNDYVIAGYHETTWDGTNSDNEYVSSGIYFYQLKTSTAQKAKRLIILR